MTFTDTPGLAGGFANSVFDSQAAFRAAMEALASPGRIKRAGLGLESAPLDAAAAALILALCDYETALHLSPSIEERKGVSEYLRFHTDSMLVSEPSAAAFALFHLEFDQFNLSAFAQGTAEYPDRSTTVIVIASSLTDGPILTLSGPGIAKTIELRVSGLPANFVDQWLANRVAFPLGVDIIFAAQDSIVGLPRSTRVLKEPC
jgi:alpha-D-ribose 1-methylphosphonate 5-triphosphate synthase subunit PhnH